MNPTLQPRRGARRPAPPFRGLLALGLSAMLGAGPLLAQSGPPPVLPETRIVIAQAESGPAQAPILLTEPPADAPDVPILLSPAGAEAGDASLDANRIVLGGTPEETAEADPDAVPQGGLMSSVWPIDGDRPVMKGRFRLAGEKDEAEFSLFLPAGEVPAALSVATVSSAYVMPGTSLVRVLVGDAVIGEFQPGNIAGAKRTELPLRPGMLQPGFNRIRIEVSHSHRLYCGYESSYDLWTDVDISQTGLMLRPAGAWGTASGFLAAVAAARGRGDAIRVLISDDDSLEAEMLQLARKIGQLVGGGLTFEIQDADRPVENADAPLIVVSRDIQSLPFARLQGGIAETLLVRFGGTGMPDLNAVFGMEPLTRPDDTIAVGTRVSLQSVGFTDQYVSQYLWEKDFLFSLPSEWLVATNERAELRLRLANTTGMPNGSRLLIFVNGNPIRMLPLHEETHQITDALPVRFSAEHLTSGRNALSFRLLVPGDPPDAVCPRVETPRLKISADSTLFVPKSPRMYVPTIQRSLGGLDLSGLMNSLRDPVGGSQLAEAMGFAAALPAAPDGGSETLVLMDQSHLDPSSFGEVWPGRFILLETLSRADPAPAPDVSALNPPANDVFGAGTAINAASLDPGKLISDGIAVARDSMERLKRLVFPNPSADLSAWLSERRGQAIIYQLDKGDPDTLYLATADEADIDTVTRALGLVANAGFGLNGHLAVLSWDGTWDVWADQSRLPILTEAISLGNIRPIIGNYASARPALFVGILIAASLLSVIAALSYISFTRARR